MALTAKEKAHLVADKRDGATAAELALKYHITIRSVYRHLAVAGPGRSGVQPRKRRSDAGSRRLEMPREAWSRLLRLVLDLDYAPEEALKVLEYNEHLPPGRFSARWVNRQLKGLNLTKRLLSRTGPEVSVRRERTAPNVEHQADATPAASIYFNAANDICYEPFDPLKKQRQAEGKSRIHIFGLLDAYSRATVLRAVLDGETMENWRDFFYYAWCQKPVAIRPRYPFFGLPKILRCDRGSGLLADTTRRALREVGVKVLPHEAGQAWKKGKIERLLQLFQTRCEPATRLKKFRTLAELNLWLERASIYLNNRIHGTTGHRPFSLWAGITADELIEPPARDDWDRLWLNEAEVRVSAQMVIKLGRGRHREEVQLQLDHPILQRYVGKKIKVLYARGLSDPIVLKLHGLAGLPATEMAVQRVRPGAMPPSQLKSNIVTFGRQMLKEARDEVPRKELARLDLDGHWDQAAMDYAVPEAGRRMVIDAETMFRPEPVSQLRAIQIGQKAGVFATPPTDGDVAFLEELFNGRQRIEREKFDRALEELRRVKKSREKPNHALS